MTHPLPPPHDALLHPFAHLPPALRCLLAEVGPRWADDVDGHIRAVSAAYTEWLLSLPDALGSAAVQDQAYGPHPRQRLDIHPPPVARNADVLVFVHGGAFLRGDKNVTPALYANVCHWFARQGVLAVNLEYRLAGDAPYPSGAEDVAAAVDHLAEVVGRHGGNPRRIFLMGHSAGGTHVAGYCCDPVLAPRFRADAVAGAILVSARLRADLHPDNPNAAAVRAYMGADEALLAQRSPVCHAERFPVPAFVAVAEHENPLLDRYGAEMFAGLLAGPVRGHRFLQLPQHNHLSIMAQFGGGGEVLGQQVLDFMRRSPAAA